MLWQIINTLGGFFTYLWELILVGLAWFFSDDVFSVLALIAVWGFFISGVDDLFIDLRYIWSVLFSSKPTEQIHMSEVERYPEKSIAVMVPAWQEADVIRAMLMRNIANIDYVNYHIFVGVYPNDPATQSEVDAVIDYYRRLREKTFSQGQILDAEMLPGDFIHKVVTPNPGPTNKADNLNAVYQRISEVEQILMRSGEMAGPFEIYMMHDCEDVIHPKEFRLNSYLMTNKEKDQRPWDKFREQFDFVQTPVFPLEVEILPAGPDLARYTELKARFHWKQPRTWKTIPRIGLEMLRMVWVTIRNLKRYTISATYMDEFTEHHTKDMIVRRLIGGLVPSAGVGTGISRTFLNKLADQTEEKKGIFNDIHLTEDYEIALHLKSLGANQYFAVEPVRMLKYRKGNLEDTYEDDEYIATKEYFPDSFRAAVKQKTRWVMGITFQTMFPGKKKNALLDFIEGWKGSLVVKYTLLRDRKALVTNFINILGYLIFFYSVVKLFQVYTMDANWSFNNLFPTNSYIWWLLLFNSMVMVERFLQRFHATRKIYGLSQALLFLTRNILIIGLIMGNLINFAASFAATWRYIKFAISSRMAGKKKEKKVERTIKRVRVDEPDDLVKVRTMEDGVDDGIVEQSESDLIAPLKTHEETVEVVETTSEPRLAWGKTDHKFLTEEQMREYVNRIGQLAVRSRVIDESGLEEALHRQRSDGKRLGDVLQSMGVIDEAGFSYLYAQQLAIPIQEIDPFEVEPTVLDIVPEDVAIEYHFVPLAIDDRGVLVIATANPMDSAKQRMLERRLARKIRLVLTYQSDLSFSRQRVYGQKAHDADAPKVLRLGGYLLQNDIITQDQLTHALYRQKQILKPLGEVLLDMGLISEYHLDGYFTEVFGLNFRRVAPDMVDLKLLETVPRIFCSIHRVIPFRERDGVWTFGAATNGARYLVELYGRKKTGKPGEIFLTPEEDIHKAISDCYNRMRDDVRQAQLLGSKLVRDRVIDQYRLDEALKHQREHKLRLGEILVSYGYCDELSFLIAYAEELFLQVVSLFPERIDPELASLYPHKEAAARNIVLVNKKDNLLVFALPYDFKEEDIRSIEDRFSRMQITYVMSTKTKIRDTIHELYVEKQKDDDEYWNVS